MKMQWGDLKTFNLYGRLKPAGYYIDTEKALLTKHRKLNWNIPWDHVCVDKARASLCGKCHVAAENLNIIPSFCLNCWKVCVTPRTLRELYKLRGLQREMAKEDPNCWCKCGAELRQYTPGRLYGGYFYTNSKQDGYARYKQVRALIDEHISPEITVVLKRYCTEFELKFGDTATYHREPNDAYIEAEFARIMLIEPPVHMQPEWSKAQVEEIWIAYGWRYGTPEDRREIEMDHNNGNPLYPPVRTYHNRDEILFRQFKL